MKNIIPAVASTNAVIAAACATEVLKLVTGCSRFMDNFMLFNDLDGIYTFTYPAERKVLKLTVRVEIAMIAPPYPRKCLSVSFRKIVSPVTEERCES